MELEACVTPEVGFVWVRIQGGPRGGGGRPRNCAEWKGVDLEGSIRPDPTSRRGSRLRPFCTAAQTNVDFKRLDSFFNNNVDFYNPLPSLLGSLPGCAPGAGGNAPAGEQPAPRGGAGTSGDAGPRRVQARNWSARAPQIQCPGGRRTAARKGSLAQAAPCKRPGLISSFRI